MMQQQPWLLLVVGALALLFAANLIEVVQPASIYAPDFNESSAHYIAQQLSCSELCGYCPTCNGFYCGEECICECAQEPHDHALCIDKIKQNSEKLGLLYDVLIQIPRRSSATRFARKADTDPRGFRKIVFSNFASAATNAGSTTRSPRPGPGPDE